MDLENDKLSLRPSFRCIKFSLNLLEAAGILLIVVNVTFTPFFFLNDSLINDVQTKAFLLRQGLSVVTVLFLIIGIIGLFFSTLKKLVKEEAILNIAFLLNLIGNLCLLGHEWGQLFFVHPLSVIEPSTLQKLEETKGIDLYDFGAIIALLVFTLSWMMLMIVMARFKLIPWRITFLVLAGFISIPLLSGLSSILGVIIGNLMIGSGWILLSKFSKKNYSTKALTMSSLS